jgi:ergothioneine biosynthesis protein EgtB
MRNRNSSAFDEISPQSLATRYSETRAFTENLAAPLAIEDCVIQSMPDVSPTRWHLAHTTWFFETFLLARALPGYRLYNPAYIYLFNSYYNSVGNQFPRPRRGLLSRPTVSEVLDYRHYVDEQIRQFLSMDSDVTRESLSVIDLGIHHEQQHQELILTDIKHVLSCNPLRPCYRHASPRIKPVAEQQPLVWKRFAEGLFWSGFSGKDFSFDNETPRHRVFVESFELASRPVTCGEYVQFIEAGGYKKPEFWLSAGWQQVCASNWESPLYWTKEDGEWRQFTLSGLQPVFPDEPVCHVSYFESDAFARWAGSRLPTEFEWELAAERQSIQGNFVENGRLHPVCAEPAGDSGLNQMFGDVWEWTSSPYSPYPGYKPVENALGEYNGKFMCNQFVLRGGSCATPRSHIRHTYRNFFPPEAQWQFSGFRLCK